MSKGRTPDPRFTGRSDTLEAKDLGVRWVEEPVLSADEHELVRTWRPKLASALF